MEIGNRKTNNIKIAVENAIYAKKIWDMRTLQKYAKNVAISELCGNRIRMFT